MNNKHQCAPFFLNDKGECTKPFCDCESLESISEKIAPYVKKATETYHELDKLKSKDRVKQVTRKMKRLLDKQPMLCWDTTDKKVVRAYHVDPMSGYAANKGNTLCIGSIKADLIPIQVLAQYRLDLIDALRDYRTAQRRMLDKWADGDESVKKELWNKLHECEEKANKII